MRKSQVCLRQFLLVVLNFFCLIAFAAEAQAIDIPVFVQGSGGNMVMLLLDDSESMNSVLEHPYYAKNKDELDKLTSTKSKEIPDIIFRLESGGGALTSSTPTKVALVNYNNVMGFGYTGNQTPIGPVADPRVTRSLGNLASADFLNHFNCGLNGCWNRQILEDRRTFWGSLQQKQNKSNGPAFPATGSHALMHFREPSVTGPEIFVPDLVEKEDSDGFGKRLEDSEGSEYIYVRYRYGRNYVCQDEDKEKDKKLTLSSSMSLFAEESSLRGRLDPAMLFERSSQQEDLWETFSSLGDRDPPEPKPTPVGPKPTPAPPSALLGAVLRVQESETSTMHLVEKLYLMEGRLILVLVTTH